MVAALVMTSVLTGTTAHAWRDNQWCAEDPVFQLLGARVSVTTYVHSPASTVSGIAYEVEVPSNAGTVRVTYPGGRRIPTTVNVSYTGAVAGDDSFSMKVSVTVTGPSGRETLVYVSGRSATSATYAGWTNTEQSFGIDVATR
jgi:hypothetical protein